MSKPDIALEESGNSAKIAPSVLVTDDRYIPPHRRDEVGLNNKSFAPNGLNGRNGNSNNSNINKPNQQIFDRTNPTLQPGVYKQEERGTGGNFSQSYMPFSQGQMNFPQAYIAQPQALPMGVDLDAVRDVV